MDQEQTYEASEIAKHNTPKDLWVSIHGKVYNVTDYTEDHPGGIDAFLEVAGQDATAAYEDVGHSEDAREILQRFLVGDLEGGDQYERNKRKDHEPAHATIVPRSMRTTDGLRSKTSSFSYSLLAVPAISVLLYEAILHFHLRDLNLGMRRLFTGFLASSVIGAGAVGLGLFALEKSLKISKDWSKYPAHLVAPSERKIPTPRGVLDPQKYQPFQIAKIDQISSDVKLITMQLPYKSSVLGLPIGQHIAIASQVGGERVTRSYTPVSNNSDLGELRLAIKMYADGRLTGNCLDKLQVGDSLDIRGPTGTMRYRKGTFRHIGMIAGGTGITPMYQVLRAIAEDPTDDTSVDLILANKTEKDIILKQDLDKWAQANPNIRTYYVLDTPPEGWKQGVGRVDKALLQERLPKPSKETQIMLCGPPGLVKATEQSLIELGFEKPSAVSKASDQIFLF